MSHIPQNHQFLFPVWIGDGSHIKTLDLAALEDLRRIDRPGPLEMDARLQNFAPQNGLAEAFQQALLARPNEDKGSPKYREQDHAGNKPAGVRAHFPDGPGVGNIEAKLIVQRVSRREENAFRFAENSDEAAVVEEPADPALDPGPVGFKDQFEQGLDCDQPDQYQKSTRDEKIGLQRPGLDEENSAAGQQTRVGAQQQKPGGGLQ